ncbi:MAG: FAD-dependent oxidoreductase [Elusimicrobia bacterium]|nr:FAD-dependent oxidoreductase [Elusimicrobiota bacterium]
MSEPSAPRHFAAKVLSVADECSGVKTFRLAVPPEFSFVPGMWVMVHFADEPRVTRAYSMSSCPLQRDSIEISLNRVGDFTARMFALQPGDELGLAGPYGKWRYRDEERHAVLISGGTGLTPFRSMGRYVLEKKLANKLSILYSVKTPADILYAEDLEAFKAAGIKVYTTVTRPQDVHWNGPVGRLDIATVKSQVQDWKEASYYLCGPKSLVVDFTEGLQREGVPRERIHYEKWGDY